MTRAGVILGTAAYMSPEQAKGKEVDKRADIFAFGAVLYELLTGKRAFQGETITETLAKILESEPEWKALPGATPWRIQELLRRCLTKEPHDRLRDIANVRVEIKLALSEPTTILPLGVGNAKQSAGWKRAIPWSITAAVMVIAGWALWSLTVPTSKPLTKMVITTPDNAPLAGTRSNQLAISPDGRKIVYQGASQLYLRQLDDPGVTPLSGTEGAGIHFFSPDGESVGFLTADALKKVSLTGGAAITLSNWPGHGLTGSWGPDDTIVFTFVAGVPDSPGPPGLYRISANGGEPQGLAFPDADKGELAYQSPSILPDGKDVLFTIRGREKWQAAVLSLETGDKTIVLEGAEQARYAATGNLVYTLPGTGNLMAVSFDVGRLEVSGSPVPILEGVRHDPTGSLDYAFSDEGTLVYILGDGGSFKSAPVWVDRDGEVVERIVDEPLKGPINPRVSPDGRRLALTVGPVGNWDTWIYDLSGRPPYPIAFGAQKPVWSQDGRRVAFTSGGATAAGSIIAWVPADGSTLEAEPLVTLSQPTSLFPLSWSSDGRELLYLQLSPESTGNIMALQLEGEREPRLVVHTEVDISLPQQHGGLAALSPDGRWLAYVSAVTGTPEIWVQAYPDSGAPIRVSPNGGFDPVWGPEGRELFYLQTDKMMAVRVETGPEFRFQPPEVLFEGGYYLGRRPNYDVGPDGRFLMIKEEESEAAPINVVLNWFEELKRLVPTP
jgi:serine/threonine-protein kinase